MAITNSIQAQAPGTGIPFQQNKGFSAFQSLANAATDGAHSFTLTFPTEQPASRGRWRIKVSTPVNTPTVVLNAYFSDGTNSVQVFVANSAITLTGTTAGSGLDFTGEFCIDIAATSFVVTITLAGSSETAVLDFEVAVTQ